MGKELVEIVRCKNCQGTLPEGRKKIRCDIYKNFGNDDFFCAFRKLKEEELENDKNCK